MGKHAEMYERALKSGKISQKQYDDFHFMKDSIALMYAHPFVEAIGIVSAMIDYSHRILLDSKLFSKKYLIKLETFAMNELLGRPAPRVLTLKPMVFEASWGITKIWIKSWGQQILAGKKIRNSVKAKS